MVAGHLALHGTDLKSNMTVLVTRSGDIHGFIAAGWN